LAPHLTLQQREHARRLRREGRTIREIAAEIGCSRSTVKYVVRTLGKRESSQIVWSPGRSRLSLADREEITRGLSVGEPLRAVARRLGRAPSTISREVKANGGRSHYRAVRAHHGAYARARRPKTPKLLAGPLCAQVTIWLEQWWSPEEIARRLRIEFPDDEAMHVSHETIYQSLFVQGRGELRRELSRCLRTGRAERRAQGGLSVAGRSRTW
jgi:IS30 family transposase